MSGIPDPHGGGTYEELNRIFEQHKASNGATSQHLERLRHLASECDTVVEFGVRHGASTSALMLGAKKVIAFDTVRTQKASYLAAKWPSILDYRIESSLTCEIPECDLIFFDSVHVFKQLDAELKRHKDKSRRWLVFHDTITYGSIGGGCGGGHLWTHQPGVPVPPDYLGIRPAIDNLMVSEPTWRMVASVSYGHGMIVLERFQR